jgi:signal transduction histidine kinase
MDAIGQLAAGIAHDFNNILTVVRGHTSLMLERPHLDAEIGASLREVSDAAERATSLASQLLAFSRKQRLKPRPFDVNETVERLHSLLHRVLGENIKIQIECALNLPTLVADEPQIEQVLINLVVNARDAMPHGGTLDIATKLVHLGASELLSYPGGTAR